MIAVQEKPKFTSLPEVQGQTVQRTVTSHLSRRQQLSLAGLVMLVFCTGVAVVFFYAQVVVTGYQINKLQKEASGLEMQVQDLSEELAHFSSLERIEMTATTKLGMVRPDLKNMIIVQAEPKNETVSGQVDTAGQSSQVQAGSSIAKAGKEHNLILQALVNLVERTENSKNQAS